MRILSFFRPNRPQPPTQDQLNVQARVIEHLKVYGGIDARTAQNLGTTSAHRMFSRLREKGYLFSASDARGHEVYKNGACFVQGAALPDWCGSTEFRTDGNK